MRQNNSAMPDLEGTGTARLTLTSGPLWEACRERLDGELCMEWMANPPTLGGFIGLVALFAWAMGRLQGVSGQNEDLRSQPRGDHGTVTEKSLVASQTGAPLSAASLSQEPRSALLAALAASDKLCDLHDEVSAFRRRERVFATFAPELLQRIPKVADSTRVCLRVGVISHPICDGVGCHAADHACAAEPLDTIETAPQLRIDYVSPRRTRPL